MLLGGRFSFLVLIKVRSRTLFGVVLLALRGVKAPIDTLGVVPLSDILDGPAPEKSMFRGVKDFGFFGTGLVLSSSSVEEFSGLLYGTKIRPLNRPCSNGIWGSGAVVSSLFGEEKSSSL